VDDSALRSFFSPLAGDVTIDYYNSLLAGRGVKVIARLQRVQNNAAKLICDQPR